MGPTLAVVLPGTWALEGGRIALTDKMLEGLAVFHAQWPGRMVLALETAATSGHNIGLRSVPVADLPYEVCAAPTVVAAVRAARADVTLATLTLPHRQVRRACSGALVLSAEMPPAERTRLTLAGVTSRSGRARVRIGGTRVAVSLVTMAREADGVQCNGLPAYGFYRRFARRAMVYYDTRLDRASVPQGVRPRESGPLRLGFSGRFMAAKGPEYAVHVADTLRRRGVDVELTMYGDGPMEPALRASAGPAVRFAGSLDFRSAWIPSVRDSVDLMVLPHVQGDPSGTYLESAGLGVPVVGFDNACLRTLVETAGIGWTVPMRDGDALADSVSDLHADPARVEEAGERGIAFMREHHFHAEFHARVRDLRDLVGV